MSNYTNTTMNVVANVANVVYSNVDKHLNAADATDDSTYVGD